MTVITAKFDPIEYTKELRKVGVSQEQANVQAQTIEQVLNEITTSKDLVTKHDLTELKLELIKWMFGITVTGVIAIAGLLKYIIH